MKKYLHIAAIAFSVGTLSTSAAPLTPAQALERADVQLQTTTRTSSAALRFTAADLAYTVSDASAQAALYVFAHKNAPGFIIAGADDVAAPVIGYSGEDSFTSSDIPCGLAWRMDAYAQQIAAARKNGSAPYKTIGRTAAADYAPIKPLCTTKWNQRAPYSDLCPMSDGNRCVTGCVATAMAQVMKKHNYPVKGNGVKSYVWLGQELTYNFLDSIFEWDKMLDVYSSTATDEQNHAVANLMVACGISVNMNYSPSGSGAYSTNVAPAMTDYFNYAASTTYLSRDSYSLRSWQDIAYQSLQAGCPIYVSGQNSSAGHAFVCDGYDSNGFFHINWGWGGTSDGYFRFTALDPATQGVGGSNAGYNIYEAFVFMAQPKGENMAVPYVLYASLGMTPSLTDNALTITGPFKNMTAVDCTGYPGVKITCPDGSVKYASEANQRTAHASGKISRINVTLPDLTADGEYVVEPMINSGTPEAPVWHMLYGSPSKPNAIWLNVKNDKISLVEPQTEVEYPTVTNVVFNSKLYRGKKFSISGTLNNINKQIENYGNLYACLINSAGSLVTYTNPLTFDVEPGESWNFTLESTWRTTPATGNYTFYFATTDAQGYIVPISEAIKVSVATAPTGTATVTVSDFKAVDAQNVPLDKQQFSLNITCTKSYFAESLVMFLFSGGGTYLGTYAYSPTLYVDEGETKSYTFNTTWALDPKTTYKAQLQNGSAYLGTAVFTTGEDTGVEAITSASGMTIVQSGASSYTVTAPKAIEGVKVYAASGATLYVPVTLNGESAEIDAAALPSGIYLVRAATAEGSFTFRILKK